MRVLALAGLLLAGAMDPGAATAKDAPAPAKGRLRLEQIHARGSFVRSIPSWSWRPGHAELVRTHSRPDPEAPKERKRSWLIAMDPATGQERDLLDLTALRKIIPGKGTKMRGIGRSGAPRFKWSKDGKSLCAVVKGDLVWVELDGGTPRRLTETKERLVDLNVSPDGQHVSFSRGNELWTVGTRTGTPRRLTSGSSETLLNATLDWVYPEEFGFRTAAWWSPDGERIAYLQMDQSKVPRYRVPGLLPLRSGGREMFYPKAGDPNPVVRLGVVPVVGGETVWLDAGQPAPEYIVRVAWSPDATRLLVVTLDRKQQHLRLVSCDPGGGPPIVLHEQRDPAWVSAPPTPRWIAPDKFVWREQRTGLRWYLAQTSDGHRRVALTPVTAPNVDAGSMHHIAGGRALFGGTRHGEVTSGLFRAAHDGRVWKSAPAFTELDSGWTSARTDESGTYVVINTGRATIPRTAAVYELATGRRVRELGNAYSPKLDAVDLAVPEYGRIPVEGASGHINWRLWKPSDLDSSKSYGLIVHVYAGPGSRMVRDHWGRGPLLNTFLCQRGFLVLEADGRGTGGQGAKWMKSVYGRLGLLELEDQVRAVKEITKRPYVDEKRVGIWGWSYGGTMVCNALTMRSDVFRAGVAVASVTDWKLYDTIYTERYMGLPKENTKGYSDTASSNHAPKMKGDLLLMHGMGDDNVHAQNTMRLIEAFIKAKKLNYDAMLYPKRGHGIGGASHDVFTRLWRHFDTHLR